MQVLMYSDRAVKLTAISISVKSIYLLA